MISTEVLRQILSDQRNNILKKDFGVEREELEKAGKKIALPHVHVITGLRRSGKSTLLRQIIHKYYQNKDFYYLNFEDERLIGFDASDFNRIYEIMLELFGEQKTFFIDEIQHVKHFDAFVRRFYDNGFKFFITGSNAGLLKEEISTKLTGRHVDTCLKPFSFNELLLLRTGNVRPFNPLITEERAEIKRYFNEYVTGGGMPEFLKFGEPELLRNIYNDIVAKDIIARKNIGNTMYVKELYQYLISSFGQRFSYNSLLKASPLKSVHTIKKYIDLLDESYMVRLVTKYDHSVRKQLANEKKLYITDNGFIPVISTRQGSDRGWLLENLVASSLDHTSEVFYFSGKKECDFLSLNMKNFNSVIQVCQELTPANWKRETEGLAEALKFTGCTEGLMLTYDQEEDLIIDGFKIRIMPVWKWLYED